MRKIWSQWLWGLVSGVSIVILGIVDGLTGHELNFFVFYFLPVSLAAWFVNLWVSLTAAFFCGLGWYIADFQSGHTYTSSFYAVWNTIIRLLSFVVIAFLVAKVRALFIHERAISEELEQTLSEVKVLEAFLSICAVCKRIRNEQGSWEHLETYIGERSGTQFSHGYCPECAQRLLEDAHISDKAGGRG